MKILAGILLIVFGVLVGLYANVYLLVTGIINIVHGEHIFWSIVKIALREVIGGLFAIGFFASGMLLISKSK